MDTDRAERLLKHYTSDETGLLHYWEFVRMLSGTMATLHHENQENTEATLAPDDAMIPLLADVSAAILSGYGALRKAFQAIDARGDKGLDAEELQQGLVHIGLQLTLDETQRLIRRFDTNHDGRLQYNQFVRMIAAAQTKH